MGSNEPIKCCVFINYNTETIDDRELEKYYANTIARLLKVSLRKQFAPTGKGLITGLPNEIGKLIISYLGDAESKRLVAFGRVCKDWYISVKPLIERNIFSRLFLFDDVRTKYNDKVLEWIFVDSREEYSPLHDMQFKQCKALFVIVPPNPEDSLVYCDVIERNMRIKDSDSINACIITPNTSDKKMPNPSLSQLTTMLATYKIPMLDADAGIDQILQYEESVRQNTPRYNQMESFMHKVNRKRGVVYFCILFLCCISGSAIAISLGSVCIATDWCANGVNGIAIVTVCSVLLLLGMCCCYINYQACWYGEGGLNFGGGRRRRRWAKSGLKPSDYNGFW